MSARRISVVAAIPLTAILLVTLLLVSVRSGAASPSAASSAITDVVSPPNAATFERATGAEVRAQPVSRPQPEAQPQAGSQPQAGVEAQPTGAQAAAQAEPATAAVLAVIDGETFTRVAFDQAQTIDRAMTSLTGQTPTPPQQIAEQLINGVIVRHAAGASDAGTMEAGTVDASARLGMLLASAGKTEADLESALAANGVTRADFDRYFAELLAVDAYASRAAQEQGVTAAAWLAALQQTAHVSYGPAYTALVAGAAAAPTQAAPATVAATAPAAEATVEPTAQPTAQPTALPTSTSALPASEADTLVFAPFPPTAAQVSEPTPTAGAPVERGTQTGQLGPDFALASLAEPGATVHLGDLRGKPTVLSFWTTWCPYCLRQTPILVEAAAAHAGDAIQFVGINVKEQAEVVTPYVAEHRIPYLVLLDPDGRAAADYGVEGYPTTYFLDADGHVVTRYIGALTAEQLATFVDQLLRSQP